MSRHALVAPDRAERPGAAPAVEAKLYVCASWLLVAGAAAAAAYLASLEHWREAAASALLAVAGAVFLALGARLPRLFVFLFTAAAAINGAGYVFELWRDPPWFDELVHLFTSFCVVAVLGWLVLGPKELELSRFSLAVASAFGSTGLLLGVLWELFEWTIGVIGSVEDTWVDLLMDTAGALAAGGLCVWSVGVRCRSAAEPGEQALSDERRARSESSPAQATIGGPGAEAGTAAQGRRGTRPVFPVTPAAPD